MRRSTAALTALTAILAGAGAAAQTTSFEQARQARLHGRLDDAEPTLRTIVRSEPENYMALYNLGLLYQMRAVRAPAGEPRLRHFRTAAVFLERAVRSPERLRPASGPHAYTIFNSLGVIYLALGDLNRANFYLQRGLRYQARLSDFSRGRLYGNLGYLAALQGDIPTARRYFADGARLGSAFARGNLERFDRAGIR